jgi:hypothetical protein
VKRLATIRNTSRAGWGSRGREFKSRQPDQTIHSIRPSRTRIQPAFLAALDDVCRVAGLDPAPAVLHCAPRN